MNRVITGLFFVVLACGFFRSIGIGVKPLIDLAELAGIILISLSFAQYAFDPVVILGSATPVASRVGHWAAASTSFGDHAPLRAATPLTGLVRWAAPLIAIFCLAAIIERKLGYRPFARD